MAGSSNPSDECPIAEIPLQAPAGNTHDSKGEIDRVAPSHPESLSVVSESSYCCHDESALVTSKSRPAGLQSIPSKFEETCAPTLPKSPRLIKIIVISDYLCSFCYLCDKILHDAIDACQDLPFCFDVEFRPFTLCDPAAPVSRNAYLTKKFGKEQADIKLNAVSRFSQKTGLKLAEDSIVCRTAQAHRLSVKAYQVGGQSLQNKFNKHIFDACLAKGANISDEDLLIDAAVHAGLMNAEEATAFLQSAECVECVEKMVEAAKAQGIISVPFVIIDGKWAVKGLQPVECFIQIFRKLARSPAPLAVNGKSKAKHEPEVR